MTEFLVVVVVVIVAVKGTLHFVKWLSNMTKETGDSIKLRCEAVGDPTPTRIRWYKNDAPVLEEKGRVVVRKYHTAGQVLSFFLCNFFIFFSFFFFLPFLSIWFRYLLLLFDLNASTLKASEFGF